MTEIHNNGDGARIAGRDYHEHNTDIREDEPEWQAPPRGSGLILCPKCKRRHIAENAIACTRCGYPQREVVMERHRRWLLEANRERAKQQYYGLLSFAGGMLLGLWRVHLIGLELFAFGALCGAAGYYLLPELEQKLQDWWRELRR
jgi:hypothetical protein